MAAEVKVCPKCELARTRTHAVPGEGNPSARVMLIGEGPGWHEDQQGLPFVGNAGKFLNELLAHAGLKREDVFITNVVKCRPPGNRDPLPDEIAACAPYLERQITAINPDVIVTLGRFSMAKWFPGERISRIHGQPKLVEGRLIVPMYHPAAALHQAALRGSIEEDFAKLPSFLAEAEEKREQAEKSDEPSPSQMKMF
ncbi:MAG: uracil-DNA glycosylase family protein [Thermomicrobiales bacterium]